MPALCTSANSSFQNDLTRTHFSSHLSPTLSLPPAHHQLALSESVSPVLICLSALYCHQVYANAAQKGHSLGHFGFPEAAFIAFNPKVSFITLQRTIHEAIGAMQMNQRNPVLS